MKPIFLPEFHERVLSDPDEAAEAEKTEPPEPEETFEEDPLEGIEFIEPAAPAADAVDEGEVVPLLDLDRAVEQIPEKLRQEMADLLRAEFREVIRWKAGEKRT